jgi:hypothetical protein
MSEGRSGKTRAAKSMENLGEAEATCVAGFESSCPLGDSRDVAFDLVEFGG